MAEAGIIKEDIVKNITEKKTILLVGRSGNGKSSIGNTILGESKFATDDNKKQNLAKAENKDFFIVDCTGIGDKKEDISLVNYSTVLELAEKAVQQFEVFGGIDIIVFVMKFGGRFTEQERTAVQIAKDVFGEENFKKWAVLAFSYGDLFASSGDTHETFDAWCREQSGAIKTLFEEVNYRCVLFDNRTIDNKMQINFFNTATSYVVDLHKTTEETLPAKYNLEVYWKNHPKIISNELDEKKKYDCCKVL